MGMDISAKLMYGLYHKDLVKDLDEEVLEWLEDALDYGDIDSASPHYDSDRYKWFVGYELTQYFDNFEVGIFMKSLEDAENKFKQRFGKTGIVKAVPDVT